LRAAVEGYRRVTGMSEREVVDVLFKAPVADLPRWRAYRRARCLFGLDEEPAELAGID
jgi:hypothetical protein